MAFIFEIEIAKDNVTSNLMLFVFSVNSNAKCWMQCLPSVWLEHSDTSEEEEADELTSVSLYLILVSAIYSYPQC